MSRSVFTPNLKVAPAEPKATTDTQPTKPDAVGGLLLKVAQYALLTLFGFGAIFFTPGIWASLGFDKAIFAVGLCALAVISISFLALRSRSVQTVLPVSLGIFWGVAAAALVSALLSGDMQDALVGSVFGPQTAGFFSAHGAGHDVVARAAAVKDNDHQSLGGVWWCIRFAADIHYPAGDIWS